MEDRYMESIKQLVKERQARRDKALREAAGNTAWLDNEKHYRKYGRKRQRTRSAIKKEVGKKSWSIKKNLH